MKEENLILIRDVLGVEIYEDTTTQKQYILEPNGKLRELEV